MKWYIKKIKPLFDYSIALFALFLLSPLFLVIGLFIKLESKGPIFFKQERLGKYGKVFKIIKFRSMTVGEMNYKDDIINYYNNPRITKVGKFLRNTNIDEIPQLINILKGDMSFIGPRPPLTYHPKQYYDYNDIERIRFFVKPGMSGLVQVRNKHCDDWDINIPIDIEYVQNMSLKLDLLLFTKSLLSFFN